jgi:hypothetical protein
MKITIEFNTETAAFEDNQLMEVTRILRYTKECAWEHMMCPLGHKDVHIIKDSNGNTIGKLKIKL